MRIIVCGDRNWNNIDRMTGILEFIKWMNYCLSINTTIVEGGAKGADNIAKIWADNNKVECIDVPAEWHKYGKIAGPMRNRRMVDQFGPINAVIAFHNDIQNSRGTKDMIEYAMYKNIPVWLVTDNAMGRIK